MSGEMLLRAVRDGGRVLRFQAAVLGSATSQRGSIPRWSELVLYRLADGTYLISKVGRSTVAHRPGCLRVNHRMQPWHKVRGSDEFFGPRTPCPDCRPDVTSLPDDALLEVPRYRAILAPDAESAARSMMPMDQEALSMPQVVRDVLAQAAQADPNFSRYADADTADPRALEKTTRTP